MHSSGGFSLTRRPQRCCSTSTSCQALSFVFSSTMAPMAAPPSASSTPQIDEHNGKNSGDCAPDDPSQSRYTRNPGSPLKRLVSIIGASLGTPPSPLASAAHSGHDRRRRPPPRRLIGQDLPAAESPASSSLDLRPVLERLAVEPAALSCTTDRRHGRAAQLPKQRSPAHQAGLRTRWMLPGLEERHGRAEAPLEPLLLLDVADDLVVDELRQGVLLGRQLLADIPVVVSRSVNRSTLRGIDDG
jgi:hypothetical protein